MPTPMYGSESKVWHGGGVNNKKILVNKLFFSYKTYSRYYKFYQRNCHYFIRNQGIEKIISLMSN